MLPDSKRIEVLERQVSFLQCAGGITAGISVSLLIAALWLAPEYLRDCRRNGRPQGDEVEPKLPVLAPVVAEGFGQSSRPRPMPVHRLIIQDFPNVLGERVAPPPIDKSQPDFPHGGNRTPSITRSLPGHEVFSPAPGEQGAGNG